VPGEDRVLVIVRHAKAQPFAEEDRARALTDRGRAAAVDIGVWLGRRGLVPDYALVSSALRTQETWEGIAQGLAEAGVQAPEPVHDQALYSGGIETVMECLHTVPDESRRVVLVGHNPTVATLVQLLGDATGDGDALRQISSGYPPGSVAVFTVPGPWAELEFSSARLDAAYVGQA
jgi:phosphohistidine phosphatase